MIDERRRRNMMADYFRKKCLFNYRRLFLPLSPGSPQLHFLKFPVKIPIMLQSSSLAAFSAVIKSPDVRRIIRVTEGYQHP